MIAWKCLKDNVVSKVMPRNLAEVTERMVLPCSVKLSLSFRLALPLLCSIVQSLLDSLAYTIKLDDIYADMVE